LEGAPSGFSHSVVPFGLWWDAAPLPDECQPQKHPNARATSVDTSSDLIGRILCRGPQLPHLPPELYRNSMEPAR
jgi:hypothetical protein